MSETDTVEEGESDGESNICDICDEPIEEGEHDHDEVDMVMGMTNDDNSGFINWLLKKCLNLYKTDDD